MGKRIGNSFGDLSKSILVRKARFQSEGVFGGAQNDSEWSFGQTWWVPLK